MTSANDGAGEAGRGENGALIGVLWSLSSLLLGIAFLGLASGALFLLLGFRLAIAGASTELVGAVMSTYFVGLLAGSVTGGRIIDRVGHIRAFTVFACVATIATLLFALTDSLAAWALLRATTGYCMAGLFLTAESWLNHIATRATRGRIFAFHLVVNAGAFALGPLTVNLGDPAGFELFTVTGILFTVAALPVALTRLGNPEIGPRTRLGPRRLIALSPLGVVGCFAAGLANSAYYGMSAVYGEQVGLSSAQTSFFLSAALVGGLMMQFPIGTLSDRFDRRRVMLVLTAAAVVAALGIGVSGSRSVPVLLALAFAFGGVAQPIYGLAVAQTNDYAAPEDFVAVSGGLLLAYSVGASMGPMAAAAVMGATGPVGLCVFLAAVFGGLSGFIVFRMRLRPPKPIPEQGEFVPVPRMTPLAAELDPRAVPAEEAPATDQSAEEGDPGLPA
ncbi:MAG: MFS transporter [Alphaproteobacteria bacterium]